MQLFQLEDWAPEGVGLALNFQTWRRESGSPSHLHDAIEVIFVTAGCGVNSIDFVQYPVIAGDLYVIKPGSVHSFYSASTLQFYNLMFRFENFSAEEQILWRRNPPLTDFFATAAKLHLPTPHSEPIRQRFEDLAAELARRLPGWELNAKAELILLLNQIGRAAAAPALPRMPSGSDPHSLLSQLLEMINRDCFRPELSLARLAAKVHRSANYLSELFRIQTGSSVTRYIHTLRLEEARRLLIEKPKLTITEVAEKCGYLDPGYFTRRFHRYVGCSPLQYRKNRKSS